MRKAYLALAALALLAETSGSTIDLAPVVSILYAILPLLLTIMVIAIVFKLIGKIFEGFGRVFDFVKLAPLALLAQTSETTVDLTPMVSILYAILPLLFTVIVIVLVFKLVGSLFDAVGRSIRAAKLNVAKLAVPLALLAQTTEAMDLAPILFTLITMILLIALPLLIFKGVGRTIKAVKLNVAKLAPLALLAQTSSGSVDLAQQITAQLTPILFTLITIILIIALPLLIFKVLAKSVIDVIRG